MERKLIFLDVDGTLTEPGGYEPPESALRAIKRARELGHRVFPCSGRNYDMMEPLMKYGFDGCITSCGGYVFAGNDVLQDCPLTERQRQRIVSLFAGGGAFLEMEAKDAAFIDEGAKRYLEDSSRNRELLRMIQAVWVDLGPKTMEEYDGRPVYKMVFVGPGEEVIAAARAELGDELEFILHDFSEPDCIFGEIINRRFDKGSAARLVAEAFGCEMKDTVGFGDSMLDLGLIRAVGTSVCMENGSSKLKEISDMVCPSVNEDGIEWAFRKIGLI